jgi:uncharacterized protein (UPF0297 family)
MNRGGYSKYNEDLLHEELRKLADISPNELKSILKSKPENITPEVVEKVVIEEKLITSTDIPEKVKKAIKLRKEFPFLNEKDCPDELKILVADMLTTHACYVKNHEKLFQNITEEQKDDIAKDVVEDYLENRQIWEELNHYKEHGAVKGEHPIFAQMEKLHKYDEMSINNLHKNRERVYGNMMKNQKLLENEPEHKNTVNRKEAVESYKLELTHIDTLIDKKG